MNGRFVSTGSLVCTTRSFYEVSWGGDALFALLINEWDWLIVKGMLEV
jgi:hypothetical protein